MHAYRGIGTCHQTLADCTYLSLHVLAIANRGCVDAQTRLIVPLPHLPFLFPVSTSNHPFAMLPYAMPLSPPLSSLSAPLFLYPPCSVCPAHSLLPLPLPYNQKSFSQMCMLAFPSIIHHQSFGRARDDGLATWEILQRVTAPAQNHRW